MHGADNSAAGQERSQNRQPERGEDQPHVPHLQHAALFLHHHRMQKCRAGQPRHQRCILHWIPSPVATPAENGIRPVRSEEDSAGQETPRHHRPAARDADPLLPGIAHDQRSQGKRERHGEAYVAQVKHGRMNHHLGILQQRVKPRAVGGKRASHQRERMSGKIQQQEEEDLNCSDDGGSIGKQPGIRLMSQPQHQSVGRQQQRPEQ